MGNIRPYAVLRQIDSLVGAVASGNHDAKAEIMRDIHQSLGVPYGEAGVDVIWTQAIPGVIDGFTIRPGYICMHDHGFTRDTDYVYRCAVCRTINDECAHPLAFRRDGTWGQA